MDSDYIFRWGFTGPVGNGIVVNTVEAIQKVNDKLGFRRILDEADLCPETWSVGTDVRFPAIVRPGTHHQGRHLYVVRDGAELTSAIARVSRLPKNLDHSWYASELITKQAEYRIFVVQGRCVCVAKKYPGNPDDVAWNVARGGRFENVHWDEWPLKAVRYGIEAFNLSGLDFGGVDVMVDGEGECYVLEINSAPSLTSPYRQQCFAKAFDYIVTHGKDPIPLRAERGGWNKFIHPAIVNHRVVQDQSRNPRGG